MPMNVPVNYYILPDNPAHWEERKEYFMSKNNIKEQKLGSSYFFSEDSDTYIIKKRFLAYNL